MFMCVYLCIKLLYKRKHHFIKDCTLSCSDCSVSQWKLGLYVTPLVVIQFLGCGCTVWSAIDDAWVPAYSDK